MIANKAYAYDLSVPEFEPDYMPNKKDFKIIKTPKAMEKITKVVKTNAKPKSKLSLVLSTLAIFTMLIIVSYRYNVISEKNLMLQRLEIEQDSVMAELATTEVAVQSIIDNESVEAYAKQQLGMQKPEKSQIVYINSNYETKVEKAESQNIFEKGIDKLKNLIENK